MGSMKVDVLWSPNHEDKFAVFTTDLSLYKVEPLKEGAAPKAQGLKISEEAFGSLQSVNQENQYMKCVAWYPKPHPDHLVAVGLANGKVVLTSFGKGGTSDLNNLIGKEFVPKHSRQCNYLAWNTVESNLLAEVLEKCRADYSVLIWDVLAKPSLDVGHVSDRRSGHMSTDPQLATKALVELGPSETTLSLDWFSQRRRTLVTGMNNKFLRIFDLRDTSRPQQVAYTKAVHGVRVDPHDEHRMASYFEGQVVIWDTRNFDKPVLTVQETKPITKLAWSPTRRDMLGCLLRDTSIIKLYDIQNSTMAAGTDELEPAYIERMVQSISQSSLSSFDWHPTNENRMLTVTPSNEVKDVRIFERIAVNWSPDIYLAWGCGRQLRQCNTVKLCRAVSEDISIKMKRRALRGYGLQKEPLENAEYVQDDKQLQGLWRWISHVKSCHQAVLQSVVMATNPSGGGRSPSAPRPTSPILGVKQILASKAVRAEQEGRTAQPPDVDFLQWQGVDGHKFSTRRKTYRSEERQLVLKQCDWIFEKDLTSSPLIDRLEAEHNYERAAALAVFTLKLGRAIQILREGAQLAANQGDSQLVQDPDSCQGHLASSQGQDQDPATFCQGTDNHLNMVAMALSGFSDDRKTLWRDMCSSVSSELTNPYLRALFAFLTKETDQYSDILDEEGVLVCDRVAFASIFLPDAKLAEYIERLTQSLVKAGRLDGLLLTGLTTEGLDLLGQYVDITSDVQSAVMTAIRGLPAPEVVRSVKLHTWLYTYRSLLDSWKLWQHRAEFDVFLNECDGRPQAQVEVYVSCVYCGKSVGQGNQSQRNRHFYLPVMAQMKTKITSCPSCRKPLPRCSLCLINMGTPACHQGMRHIHQPDPDPDEDSRLSKFGDWFTWCQTCRHGGHADHLAEWFKEHAECPVTGCSCKCASLDSVSSSPTSDTSLTHSPSGAAH